MSSLLRKTSTVFAVAALGAGYSAYANAGCSYSDAAQPASAWLQGAALGAPGLQPAQKNDGQPGSKASIVGLWRAVFLAKDTPGIPDNTVIDDALATWHSDGTEIMNSSRPPITGNFCMGVWERKGSSTFKLKHVALAWDPSGTAFVGQGIIRQTVSLNRSSNGYSGTFTLDQYALDGVTVLAHIAGTVTGTRITVD